MYSVVLISDEIIKTISINDGQNISVLEVSESFRVNENGYELVFHRTNHLSV